LDYALSDMTYVAKETMDGLEKTGKELLEEKVKKINLDTFSIEEGVVTNAEALDRCKKIEQYSFEFTQLLILVRFFPRLHIISNSIFVGN